jgi:hypothetical protein
MPSIGGNKVRALSGFAKRAAEVREPYLEEVVQLGSQRPQSIWQVCRPMAPPPGLIERRRNYKRTDRFVLSASLDSKTQSPYF